MVATLEALKQVQPLLQSLGLGGAAPQRTARPKTQPGGSDSRKAAGDDGNAAKRSKGAKAKDPDAHITIRDHEGKPAMVKNFEGQEVPIVSICYGCHWPYWSQNWTKCVNCTRKRDPVAWPEPKVFRHWLVKAVGAEKTAEDSPAAAPGQPATAVGPAVAVDQPAYPWDGEELEDLFADDAPMADPGAHKVEAEAADAGNKQQADKGVTLVAMPSGLTRWWIRFLLKQG